MPSGDAHETVPTAEWAPTPASRRSAWPWIIVIVIVAGLAIAAWFAAEWIARTVVENTIRDQVVGNLALPADHPVDVEVSGAVIPQLIGGSLDDIAIASDDVALGPVEGDVTVEIQGLAIRGDVAADAASATIRLDEDQVRVLMATVDGFPAESLGLAAPDVTMTTDLQFFGTTFPVGVALTPSAADGEIVLTPSALQLGGTDISAGDLRDRFGAIADAVLRDWTVCIAGYIPSGVVLQDVDVIGDEIVAALDIDGRIVADPALQARGSCT